MSQVFGLYAPVCLLEDTEVAPPLSHPFPPPLLSLSPLPRVCLRPLLSSPPCPCARKRVYALLLPTPPPPPSASYLHLLQSLANTHLSLAARKLSTRPNLPLTHSRVSEELFTVFVLNTRKGESHLDDRTDS